MYLTFTAKKNNGCAHEPKLKRQYKSHPVDALCYTLIIMDELKLAIQIKRFIKDNTNHLNLDECSEFSKGYFSACEQINKIIDEYPLGELLSDADWDEITRGRESV